MSRAVERRPDWGPAAADLRAVGRGAGINLLGTALGGVGQLGLIYVITRGLHTGGAGALFLGLAWFAIAVRVGELGVDAGLSRAIPRIRVAGSEADVRRTIWVALLPTLATGAALAAAMFLLADRLAGWLGQSGGGDVASVTRILSPFIPIAVLLAVASAATRGFGVMSASSLVDRGLRPVVQAASVAAAIALGASVSGAALAWALPGLLACLIVVIWLRLLVRRSAPQLSGAGREPMATAAAFWRFTLPRGAAGAIQIATLSAGTLLVGHYLGVREAGIYAASARVLLVGNVIILAFMQVTAPKISELLATGRTAHAEAVYSAATAWQMLLTWPVYLSLGLLAPPLLGVLGPGFAAGAHALAILCVGMLLVASLGPADVVLLMSGRSGLSMAYAGLGCLTAVALNVVLDPRIGISGAAIALAAGVAVRNAAAYRQIRRRLGIGGGRAPAATAAACALACYAIPLTAVRAVASPTLAVAITAVIFSTALYAAAVWLTRQRLQLPVLAHGLRARGSAGSWIAGKVPLEVEVGVEDRHRREAGGR